VKPWRYGVRGLVVDPAWRTLLVRFDFPPFAWTPPGGGKDRGEADEPALRRELAEELGLDDFELGPVLWEREHEFGASHAHCGQRERAYLVRVAPFEPAPRVDLSAEHVGELRWWTLDEIEASTEIFGPRALPGLLRHLVENGPPARPPSIGT
jgi:8-oxo-dGTP pyrophosphatase MutT (NUDIX family)